MTGNVDSNVRPDPDQILVKIADYVLDKNIESKEALTIAIELKKKLIENNINMICLDKLKKFN